MQLNDLWIVGIKYSPYGLTSTGKLLLDGSNFFLLNRLQ
jgi:hypothetical protein